MKRLVGLLLVCVMMFVLMGCMGALKLTDLKGDLSEVEGLLTMVEKCPADKQGWKILEIPEIPEKKIGPLDCKFLIYKQDVTGNYGFGILNEEGSSVCVSYRSDTKEWVLLFMGYPKVITVDEAADFWSEWVGLLKTNGDLQKAGPFKQFPEKKGIDS
ncbi:MAG: hypothetical protein EHM49_00645 [Deltaproteobacteria bacterium]|nr:MAG: hypothetical protein EHM49_00645 [Deltaproteobacteria bacterium]